MSNKDIIKHVIYTVQIINDTQDQLPLLLNTAAAACEDNAKLQGCVDQFFERVIPSYSDVSFYTHFRMTKTTMQVMIGSITW